MRNEKDRKAFYRDTKANEERAQAADWEARIQYWLRENPSIGRLNGNKFYTMVDGIINYLVPLQIIKS